MTSELELMMFVTAAKSARQIADHFENSCRSTMNLLIQKGYVEFFDDANPLAEQRYQPQIVRMYLATGKPYENPNAELSARQKYLSEYHQANYAKKKAKPSPLTWSDYSHSVVARTNDLVVCEVVRHCGQKWSATWCNGMVWHTNGRESREFIGLVHAQRAVVAAFKRHHQSVSISIPGGAAVTALDVLIKASDSLSPTRRLRESLLEIGVCQELGIPNKNIVEALQAQGLNITLIRFNTYLSKLRKERKQNPAERSATQTPLAAAPVN